MPFVHISLRTGKSPEYIRAIADGVDSALTETFDVPTEDRFQVVHQHAPHEFYYRASYLGVQRSDDLVYIQIFGGKPRSLPKKRTFFRTLAAKLQTNPGLRPDDLFVVITTNTFEDWSFGRGEIQMIPADA